jgi:glycosyltransferase involved in cell wall biosynthesis
MRISSKETRNAPWLLVAEGFHGRGGMDKANAALANYLSEQRIPVHLVAYSVDPDLAAKPGVTVSRAAMPAGSPFLGGFHLARLGRAVARQQLRRFPDARVVVNGINCNWPDINWIHWIHQCWHKCGSEGPLWFRFKHRLETALAVRTERAAFRRTTLFLANSERTRRDLITLGIEPERINTIRPGNDSDWRSCTPQRRAAARAWLSISTGQPLIAFVGALGHDSRKGFDTLWRAWRSLCGVPAWDANLVVAGGGRALAKWRSETERSGLNPRVRFLGFTERIADVLAAADLLVSPARYESYGLNVQEALCAGVPAIVSASAGVADRFSPELGELLLPDPEDSGDLAARMLKWRGDIAGWKRRLEPITQALRAYTWDDMAEQIVSLAEGTKFALSTRTDARAIRTVSENQLVG